MTTYVMITTVPSVFRRGGLAYECQVIRTGGMSAARSELGEKRTFERDLKSALSWARSWVGDRRIEVDGEPLVAVRLREVAAAPRVVIPSMLEALKLAEVALKHSRPTHDHYDEPVARHAAALASVRAAIAANAEVES